MGANIVRVEPQALEDNIGGMEAKEGGNLRASDFFRKRTIGEKIGADGGIRVGLV